MRQLWIILAAVLEPGLVRQAWDVGRACHPRVDVPEAAFVGFLADREDVGATLIEHAADLYLACGCSLGAPGAAEAFDECYVARVETYIGRLGRDPEVVTEVQQRLRIRFLVAGGAQPARIAGYR